MYRENHQIHMFEILMEDTFTLDTNNRWVKKARMVPWDKAEEKYKHMFQKHGRPAKSIRMALGALLIQQTLETSDEETLEQITENPYLQHFIGLTKFTNQPPFDASLMVWFRKRLTAKFLAEINREMTRKAAMPPAEQIEPSPQIQDDAEDRNKDDDDGIGGGEGSQADDAQSDVCDDDQLSHGGRMILDATCAPADIAYPTDTGLLADAVEKSDALIDVLHAPHRGQRRRPRTYRILSRKTYTRFARNRKPHKRQIRTAKRKLLGFLNRNLAIIQTLVAEGGRLTERQKARLRVLDKVYEQQKYMYDAKTHSVQDRIVSISQPHIRPIVRGKASASVEFGAKIDAFTVHGYVFLSEIRFDAFNEGSLLENAIMEYVGHFGMLPNEILADRAYQTRENRQLCNKLGVRLMGRPPGRPPRNPNPDIDHAADNARRNLIESRFGILKTCYGWRRVRARLVDTTMACIAVAALAFNLSRLLARFFFIAFCPVLFRSAASLSALDLFRAQSVFVQ